MSIPPRGHWLRALSLVAGALLALGLGEALLRVARPERLATIEYPCFYEPDARSASTTGRTPAGRVAGHFEIENLAVTNSLGFYDDEPLPAGAAQPAHPRGGGFLHGGDERAARRSLDRRARAAAARGGLAAGGRREPGPRRHRHGRARRADRAGAAALATRRRRAGLLRERLRGRPERSLRARVLTAAGCSPIRARASATS